MLDKHILCSKFAALTSIVGGVLKHQVQNKNRDEHLTNLALAVSPSLETPTATPSSYTTSTSGLASMYVPPYTALRRANACKS